MKYRIYKVIWNISLLGVGGFLYYLFGKYSGVYMPCLFHTVTGLYCPGCGITRMIIALSERNLYKAFRSNEAVFILLPFLSIELFGYIIRYVKADIIKVSKIHSIFIYVILISVIIFGILRNIPYFYYLRTIG